MKIFLVIINSSHVCNEPYINLLEEKDKLNKDQTWLHQNTLKSPCDTLHKDGFCWLITINNLTGAVSLGRGCLRPQRLYKVHQARMHICFQPSGQTAHYASLPLKAPICAYIPGSPSAYLWAHSPLCLLQEVLCLSEILLQISQTIWTSTPSIFTILGSLSLISNPQQAPVRGRETEAQAQAQAWTLSD